jgi:hypothetical protein
MNVWLGKLAPRDLNEDIILITYHRPDAFDIGLDRVLGPVGCESIDEQDNEATCRYVHGGGDGVGLRVIESA